MTREERLDWLCRLRSEIYVYMPYEWIEPMDEALTDSIKGLEQEPKKGHWIKSVDSYGNNHFTCPFCGHDIATKYNGTWRDNYCSNCGAKMESEVVEDA